MTNAGVRDAATAIGLAPEQFRLEFDRVEAEKSSQLVALADLWAYKAQYETLPPDFVDRLVLITRELNHRATQERHRVPRELRLATGVRVDYAAAPMHTGTPDAESPDAVVLSVGQWLKTRAGGYASTTAGHLRAVFTATGNAPTVERRLDGEALRTLPNPLPADDDTVVLLFDARQDLAQMFLALADDLDETVCDERREHVISSLCRGRRRPSAHRRARRDGHPPEDPRLLVRTDP